MEELEDEEEAFHLTVPHAPGSFLKRWSNLISSGKCWIFFGNVCWSTWFMQTGRTSSEDLSQDESPELEGD